MDNRIVEMSERIAALEQQAEHGQTDRDEMKKEIKANSEDTKAIRKDLHDLLSKVSKWEGKFGGVIFIIGCLWAFFTGIPSAIVDWIKAFGVVK